MFRFTDPEHIGARRPRAAANPRQARRLQGVGERIVESDRDHSGPTDPSDSEDSDASWLHDIAAALEEGLPDGGAGSADPEHGIAAQAEADTDGDSPSSDSGSVSAGSVRAVRARGARVGVPGRSVFWWPESDADGSSLPAFKFTPKKPLSGRMSWQATCYVHQPLGKARCTRTRIFACEADEEVTLRMLKHWCLCSVGADGKSEHQACRAPSLADLPSEADLDAQLDALRCSMPDRPAKRSRRKTN